MASNNRGIISDRVLVNNTVAKTIIEDAEVWEVENPTCECDDCFPVSGHASKIMNGIVNKRITRAPLDIESIWETWDDLMIRLEGSVGALYDGEVVSVLNDPITTYNGTWEVRWNRDGKKYSPYVPATYTYYAVRFADDLSLSEKLGWAELHYR